MVHARAHNIVASGMPTTHKRDLVMLFRGSIWSNITSRYIRHYFVYNKWKYQRTKKNPISQQYSSSGTVRTIARYPESRSHHRLLIRRKVYLGDERREEINNYVRLCEVGNHYRPWPTRLPFFQHSFLKTLIFSLWIVLIILPKETTEVMLSRKKNAWV